MTQIDLNHENSKALLTHRIEDTEKMAQELRDRVRKLERWVWGAGAIITALITIVGLIEAVDSKEIDYGRNDSTQQEVVLQLSRS